MVGNAGGHLMELQALEAAFEGHTVFYVTDRRPWTRAMQKKKPVHLLPGFGFIPWPVLRLILRITVSFPVVLWLWLRLRPDCVLSTGAELAIPAFWIGKMFGAKTVYVECFTRVHAPSRAGRIVLPVTDVFLSQQPEMTRWDPERIGYEGCIL